MLVLASVRAALGECEAENPRECVGGGGGSRRGDREGALAMAQ